MRNWVLPIILVLELMVVSLLSGRDIDTTGEWLTFLTRFGQDLIIQSAPLLLLALGMTLVLMTGGIDLSIGSATALIACVMASMPVSEFWLTALPIGLAVGLLLGSVNGIFVSRLDVPPIVTTLGTMILFRGVCFIVMGDREKGPFLEAFGYEWLSTLPVIIFWLAAGYGLLGYLFYKSRWRRDLLMIGGNKTAAWYAAIPVPRRLFQVYVLMGILAYVAAILLTSRNGSVTASSFTGLELQVIVAVVLGGTPVQGGSGSLRGTFWAVFILAVLDEGLRSAALWGNEHLPFKISHLEYLFLGVLLVVGVHLNAKKSQGRL